MTSKVLSLGQCAADSFAIKQTIEATFDVEVVGVDTLSEAMAQLKDERFSLILVNRILDRDGASGLSCIEQIQNRDGGTPIMLVSNLAGAQKQALTAGAVPGFGKAELNEPKTLTQLHSYLTRRDVEK